MGEIKWDTRIFYYSSYEISAVGPLDLKVLWVRGVSLTLVRITVRFIEIMSLDLRHNLVVDDCSSAIVWTIPCKLTLNLNPEYQQNGGSQP